MCPGKSIFKRVPREQSPGPGQRPALVLSQLPRVPRQRHSVSISCETGMGTITPGIQARIVVKITWDEWYESPAQPVFMRKEQCPNPAATKAAMITTLQNWIKCLSQPDHLPSGKLHLSPNDWAVLTLPGKGQEKKWDMQCGLLWWSTG